MEWEAAAAADALDCEEENFLPCRVDSSAKADVSSASSSSSSSNENPPVGAGRLLLLLFFAFPLRRPSSSSSAAFGVPAGMRNVRCSFSSSLDVATPVFPFLHVSFSPLASLLPQLEEEAAADVSVEGSASAEEDEPAEGGRSVSAEDPLDEPAAEAAAAEPPAGPPAAVPAAAAVADAPLPLACRLILPVAVRAACCVTSSPCCAASTA